MELKAIKCQECGAPIPWDGASRVLECSYCGMVYERVQSQRAKKRYVDQEGSEYLVGYYPPNFDGFYRSRNEGNQPNISCIEKPIKAYYEMSSVDGAAHILFITSTVYHHIDPAVSRGRQNFTDQSLRRYRSFTGASGYSDVRFTEEHPQAENVRVVSVEKPREQVVQSLAQMRQQNSQGLAGATYSNEFERVYETITLGPAYYKMEATVQQMFTQTQNVIAGNQMRMHQAQMASSQRMGQMINDTYAYGMELDRQSWANTQATMDRVNDMRSESLREVNSYHTGDGRYVEADIGFDNVYRNAADSDWYAATEGMIDMGSDWVQLKKRY